MRISVLALSGKGVTYDVGPTTTCSDLKMQVLECIGARRYAGELQLFRGCDEVPAGAKLGEAGVGDGDCLSLLVSSRRCIATASADGTAKVWSADSGVLLRTLPGHSDAVTAVSFAPGGDKVVTASMDHSARVWDVASGECLGKVAHRDVVSSARFSPDGNRVLTSSFDQSVRVWQVGADEGSARTFDDHQAPVVDARFAPNGHTIYTASVDGGAMSLDTECGGRSFPLGKGEEQNGIVVCSMPSPCGLFVASACSDGRLNVYRAEAAEELLYTRQAHSATIRAIAFSHCGRRFATASFDGTAKLWDAASGVCELTLESEERPAYSAEFSPDGSRVLTAHEDARAIVWCALTGARILTLEGHTDTIRSAVYAPDGATVLTGSDDGDARVWDAETGVCIFTLAGHAGAVYNAAFSPEPLEN